MVYRWKYIGPYRIIRGLGQVAYKLEFPLELEPVHSVFNASIKWECIGDTSQVVQVDDIQIIEDLPYEKVLVAILDRQVHKLRGKDVASMKVLWRNKYPHLFHKEGDPQSWGIIAMLET